MQFQSLNTHSSSSVSLFSNHKHITALQEALVFSDEKSIALIFLPELKKKKKA